MPAKNNNNKTNKKTNNAASADVAAKAAAPKTIANFDNASVVELTGTNRGIVIDVSKELGPSSTGKTILVATSRGNKPVGLLSIGLNVYRYETAKKPVAPQEHAKGDVLAQRQNCTIGSLGGTKIAIQFDASQELGQSASGKSVIVATTGGNVPIVIGPTQYFVGFNAYKVAI